MAASAPDSEGAQEVRWEAVFESITNIEREVLDQILLHRADIPEGLSARSIRDGLSGFLDISNREAAEILDVHPSQISRRDGVDHRMLDRTYALTRTYEHVAAASGPSDAKAWLTTPNPGLDDERPLDLLRTRYGQEKVENLIEALRNGAVL